MAGVAIVTLDIPESGNACDGKSYPELRREAERIADDTCRAINDTARRIESAMPYKAQFILEEAIAILQSRV